MCASSSTTRIFEVTAIPSIDHRAVSALSRLSDRNVNSPHVTSPPCGEVGSGATRPCRVGAPSPPHLVGISARARRAPAGWGDPHLPTLWGGRLGRDAPLPGGGTDLSLSARRTSFSGFPVNPNLLRTFFSRYRR